MRKLFGIQLGDIFSSKTEVIGNAVNTAALLQPETAPGGIFLLPTVYKLVKTCLNLEATYLGSPKLKSIQQAVPAYQTVPASQASRGNAAMPEAEKGVGTSFNNRYRIQKVLGQGSFGRTYLASDEYRFDELCVLKEFVPGSRAEYTVQKSRAVFEREALVLYQINHPQIPKFLACFAQMGRLFLVQEYIDGKTYSDLLRERQQQGKLFSEAEVLQWLKDLLPVLTYLHSRNIVHRNISPDNVMLPNDQLRPMLIDFGFGYAAPEQLRLGQCYPCSDLYALGVAAVVLLTGLEPNLLMDRRCLEWQWHDKVKISDDLAKILDKMIAEKPQERYQSALEVQASLYALALPGASTVPTPRSDLHIEIDIASLERQVAEIEQMDYFQQLLKEAESLRNSVETDSLPQTT